MLMNIREMLERERYINDTTDGSYSVEAPVINHNDCGKIGG